MGTAKALPQSLAAWHGKHAVYSLDMALCTESKLRTPTLRDQCARHRDNAAALCAQNACSCNTACIVRRERVVRQLKRVRSSTRSCIGGSGARRHRSSRLKGSARAAQCLRSFAHLLSVAPNGLARRHPPWRCCARPEQWKDNLCALEANSHAEGTQLRLYTHIGAFAAPRRDWLGLARSIQFGILTSKR